MVSFFVGPFPQQFDVRVRPCYQRRGSPPWGKLSIHFRREYIPPGYVNSLLLKRAIEISLIWSFNSMVDLSIVEHGFQLVGGLFFFLFP